jgi:uncharacterized protein (TIRG00374 family)
MRDKSKASFLARNWKLLLNLVTLVALAILIYAIREDLVQTFRNLWQVNAWFLLLMIPVQFLNYDAQARIYKGIFKTEGSSIDYWHLMRVTLELNFVNHVFPSGGVTGITYFSLRLKRHGVSVAKATAAHMLKLIMIFLSFEFMIVLAVIALAVRGHMNNLVLLIAASLVTSLVILTFGMVFIIGSRERIAGFFSYASTLLNRLIHVFRRGHPETIKVDRVRALFEEMHEYYVQFSREWRRLGWPLFWAFMANFWEIMTIFVVYVAFGHIVNIGAIILAYAIANSAGFVSVLPGGIGIYEGLMTLVLSATGVPSKLSLPVTVMYRVVNTLIQVPAGYVAYQDHLRHVGTAEKKIIEQLEVGDDGGD